MLPSFHRWPPSEVVVQRGIAIRLAFLLSLMVLLLGALACSPPLTAADIEQHGTRVYTGQDSAAIERATTTALQTLGFEVVPDEGGSGRVRTAPKLLQVTAVGGHGSATAYGDSLAWTVEIEPADGGDVVVRAIPRAYRNGQSLPDSEMNATYMVRAFEGLFQEIDDNLGSEGQPLYATQPAADENAEPHSGNEASSSSQDRLRALERLCADGTLSPEECEEKRAKILASP